jgi:hypothetical protein
VSNILNFKFQELEAQVENYCKNAKLKYERFERYLRAVQKSRRTRIAAYRKKGISFWSSTSELMHGVPKIFVRLQGINICWLRIKDDGTLEIKWDKSSKTQQKCRELFQKDIISGKVSYRPGVVSEELKRRLPNEHISRQEMTIHAALHELFYEPADKSHSLASWKRPSSPFNPIGEPSSWGRVIFQLPLPVSASNKELKPSKGFADLILRLKGGGNRVPICVLEIKAEKNIGPSEAGRALRQAFAYSVALRWALKNRSAIYKALLGLSPQHQVSAIYAQPTFPNALRDIVSKMSVEVRNASSSLRYRGNEIPIYFGYVLYGREADSISILSYEKTKIRLA